MLMANGSAKKLELMLSNSAVDCKLSKIVPGFDFWVNIGPDVSVVSREEEHRKCQSASCQLYAGYTNQETLIFDLKLGRSLTWQFCVAAVSRPIIRDDSSDAT